MAGTRGGSGGQLRRAAALPSARMPSTANLRSRNGGQHRPPAGISCVGFVRLPGCGPQPASCICARPSICPSVGERLDLVAGRASRDATARTDRGRAGVARHHGWAIGSMPLLRIAALEEGDPRKAIRACEAARCALPATTPAENTVTD